MKSSGEELITNLEITGVDSEGRGVGRHGGKVVFIPYTVPGDIINARIISHEASFDTAELTNILQPSPDRIEPRCEYFGRCPGCSYQNINYELELRLKGQRITECLRKIAHIEIGDITVTGSPEIYGYRNHVTLHVRYENDRPVCGLIDDTSEKLVDIDRCHLLPSFAIDLPREIKEKCRQYVSSEPIRARYRLPFIIDPRDEKAILVPDREKSKRSGKGRDLLFEELAVAFSGDGIIHRFIADGNFRFSPRSFSQANESLMHTLYEKTSTLSRSGPPGRLLDLYCGVGVLGIISDTGDGVTFVDYSGSSINDVRHNIKTNRIENAEVIEMDIDKGVSKIFEDKSYVRGLVNPPRKGLGKGVTDALNKSSMSYLVYVSCNPATLARDIARLVTGGFVVQTVAGVDMFPRTPHVETIVVLTR